MLAVELVSSTEKMVLIATGLSAGRPTEKQIDALVLIDLYWK